MKAVSSRKNGHKTFTDEGIQPNKDAGQSSLARLVLDSVGEDVSGDILGAYVGLLRTSVVVCDQNGTCCLSALGSGWCRFLDEASQELTGHSHAACWAEICQACLRSGKSVDVECRGGIRAYAVPILVRGETIGSISFGYGDPPKDVRTLQEVGDRFGLGVARLAEEANSYEPCPSSVVELCKRQLAAIARLLGALVESNAAGGERASSPRTADSGLLRTAFHEMRGMLTAVKGYSGMLLDYGDRLQSEDKRRYLEAMGCAADGLAGLVERLRDICLPATEPPPPRRVPLPDRGGVRAGTGGRPARCEETVQRR